jgi:hypothetical protein
MPACSQGKPILEKILSEDLAVATLDAQSRSHLEGCPACRQELAAWHHVDQALSEVKYGILRMPIPEITIPDHSQSMPQPGGWRFLGGDSTMRWAPSRLLAIAVSLCLILVVGVGIATLGWRRPQKIAPARYQDSSPFAHSPGLSLGATAEGRVIRGTVVDSNQRRLHASERFPLDGTLLSASGSALLELPEGVNCELVDACWRCRPAGVEMQTGQREFHVAKPRSRRFTVTVPVAVLGVRGTRFKVRIYPDESVGVEVAEGCVEVVTIKGAKTLLNGGQGIMVAATGALESLLSPRPETASRSAPPSEALKLSSGEAASVSVFPGEARQATSTLRQALNE